MPFGLADNNENRTLTEGLILTELTSKLITGCNSPISDLFNSKDLYETNAELILENQYKNLSTQYTLTPCPRQKTKKCYSVKMD